MWDKARALNSNPVNKGSEVDLHDRLKDAMGSSPIYTTKRDFIIRRLKEGTDHVGFINIDWQDAGEDDLGHALGGAQLHYKYDKGPPCTVAFTVKDTYDFSKKGHMWDHLQDKGRLVTYDVEVEVETQTVSGVK